MTASGDTLRGTVEFKDPFLGSPHVLLDGERREAEDFSVLHLDGETLAVVDGGRRLARLVRDGRVRFYSRTTSTPGMMVPNAGPGGGMSMAPGTSSETGYVQVGAGPVRRATVSNLRDAIGDHPESARLLDQYRTLGYVQWAATGAGLAVAGIGLASMLGSGEDELTVNPLLVVGLAGAAVGGYVLPRLRDGARDRAIDVYNE